MYMPPDIADMIDADVQALVWAHVPEFDEFDVEAEGTELSNRRWVTRGAQQFLPHREGGLALLHWPSHLNKRCMQPPG
jgi:hypothetical protein